MYLPLTTPSPPYPSCPPPEGPKSIDMTTAEQEDKDVVGLEATSAIEEGLPGADAWDPLSAPAGKKLTSVQMSRRLLNMLDAVEAKNAGAVALVNSLGVLMSSTNMAALVARGAEGDRLYASAQTDDKSWLEWGLLAAAADGDQQTGG